MKNPRLVYRVILKLFALSGIAIVLYVLVASLFVNQEKTAKSVKPIEIIKLDLTGMNNNEIRKTYWQGKQIIVLKLSNKNKYSVYFNTGDSGNCPLFYASEVFKDTCTGTLYDQSGLQINTKSPNKLLSPPYLLEGNIIIIGKS